MLTFSLSVIEHKDKKITLLLLQDLQAFIASCLRAGLTFGPSLRLLQADSPSASGDSDPMSVDIDPEVSFEGGCPSFGSYFRLDRAKIPGRIIYEPHLESLLLSCLNGAQFRGAVDPDEVFVDPDAFGPSEVCGRCNHSGSKKVHSACIQFYISGLLYKDGVCGNCLYAGETATCSFRRKSLNAPQPSFFPQLQKFFLLTLLAFFRFHYQASHR